MFVRNTECKHNFSLFRRKLRKASLRESTGGHGKGIHLKMQLAQKSPKLYCFTVDSIFIKKCRDSVRVFPFAEIIGPYMSVWFPLQVLELLNTI